MVSSPNSSLMLFRRWYLIKLFLLYISSLSSLSFSIKWNICNFKCNSKLNSGDRQNVKNPYITFCFKVMVLACKSKSKLGHTMAIWSPPKNWGSIMLAISRSTICKERFCCCCHFQDFDVSCQKKKEQTIAGMLVF